MKKNTKVKTVKLSNFAFIELGYPCYPEIIWGKAYYEYYVYRNPSCAEAVDTYCSYAPISKQYLTQIGDIIVNTTNLNDVVLIEKAHEGLLVFKHYLIIRCNPHKVSPEFICREMLAKNGYEQRRKLCRDAVLPHQKAAKYAALKFKLPPLEMQVMSTGASKKPEDSLQAIIDAWNERRNHAEEEARKQQEEYLNALLNREVGLVFPGNDSILIPTTTLPESKHEAL